MANNTVTITITAKDQASKVLEALAGNTDKFSKNAGSAASHTDRLNNSWLKTGAGALAGGVAVHSFTGFMSQSIDAAKAYTNALTGLATVARSYGQNEAAATAAAQDLAADGFMTVTDAATGLKNLLGSGFALPEAIQLMKGLKEQSAFNRQSYYDLGGAVVATTEGIKNGNSVLADATGTTKNLSIMAKEAGVGIDEMGSISQNAAYRQAVFNGFMTESSRSMGDLAKLSQTAAGADVQAAAAKERLQRQVGALANAIRQPLVQAFAEFLTHNQMAIVSFGAGTIAAGVFAGGMFLAIRAVQMFSLSSLIAAATNPLVLTLTAIGLLAGAVVYKAVDKAQQKVAQFGAQTEKTGNALGSTMPVQSAKATKAAQELADKLDDISRSTAKATRDFRESLAQMVNDHQDKVSELKSQIADESDSFKQSAERQAADFAASQAEMADEHGKRADKIQQQLDQELALGKWADQQKIRDLQEQLTEENAEYDAQNAEKVAKYNQDVTDNKLAHDKKLLDLQTQLDGENALLNKHAADVASIRNVTLLDEIDKLKRSHDEQLIAFQRQKDDVIKNAQETAGGVGSVWDGANSSLNDKFGTLGNTMGSEMGKAFKKALADSFKDIGKTVKDKAASFGDALAKNTPGTLGTIFKIFHDIGYALGPDARAEGGPVSSGKPYLVGERGPELIVPNRSGTVIPANQTAAVLSGGGSAGGVVINQTNHIYNQFDLTKANAELGYQLSLKGAA